jgi:hypothetical protein
MPTYTINGKKVTTDRELSEDEIDEIAVSVGAPNQSTAEEARLLRQQAQAQNRSGVPGEAPKTWEQAQQGVAAEQEQLAQLPSAKDRAVSNFLSGAATVPVLGAAAKGLQIATQGTRAAKIGQGAQNLLTPKGPVDLLKQMFIGGAATAGGSELANQVVQKTGQEGWRLPLEIAGGLGVGIAANTAVNTVPTLATAGYRRLTGQAMSEAGKAADMVGEVGGLTKVKQALDVNPNLAGDLKRAKEIEELTGVKLPVLAAGKGDTTFEGLLSSQTTRGENAPFIAQMKQQYDAAQDAVKEAQKRLAGDPRNAQMVADVKAKKAQLAQFTAEKVSELRHANINRQIGEIDQAIATETAKIIPSGTGKEEVGTRLTNLLSAREAALREQFKPLYKGVIEQGKADGVQLQPAMVGDLWNFVKQRQAEDVFNKFPELDGKIKSLLAPKGSGASNSKFAEKYPQLVRAQPSSFKPLDVEQIDSLKRAVNKALSTTKDADQARMLTEFKKRFQGTLDTLPDSFKVPYKEIDNLYAQKVGQVFNQEGVLTVDRARFVEQVVPNLTTKPSAVRQILAATDNSPEGAKIVEDALVMDLSQKAGLINLETQKVNPLALNAYLASKKEILDQVPGLQQRLEGLANNTLALNTKRAELLDQQKNAAVKKMDDVWTKAYGAKGGFQGFVQSALGRRDQMDELINLAGSDPALQRGLKSSVLDIGLNSPNKTQFFEDNAQTINTLFGKGYSEQVKALMEASERLAQNPMFVKINQSLTQKTGFEQLTGTAPAQAASLIRQQVQSTFYKVSTLLSRFTQNRSTKAENATIQEFLANPDFVKDANKIMAELENNAGGIKEATLNAVKGWLKRSANSALVGMAAPAASGLSDMTERQPYTPFQVEEEQEF